MENIILGIIQGITEFVPISSSGHLALFSEFLKAELDVPYFAVLHLATFFAVVIFVWREIWDILKGIFSKDKKYLNLAGKLIVSTLPAIIVGFTIDNIIEDAFSAIKVIAFFLIITAVMNFFSDRLKKEKKDLNSITYVDALIIGLIQAFAIFPGISRSGSTIFAALLLGMTKKSAVKYSFLMSLPVTFGAGVLKISSVSFTSSQNIGIILSFISGLFGLRVLKKAVISGKLKIFSIYCLVMSLFVFIYF